MLHRLHARLRALAALAAVVLLGSSTLGAQEPCFPDWTNETFAWVASELTVHGDHLWVGTEFGGVLDWNTTTGSVTKYTRAPHCLPSNFIADIAADPTSGDVWAATDRGLAMLPGDGSTGGIWRRFPAAETPLGSDSVTAVAVEQTGVVWVGTFDAGLYRIEDDAWTRFDTTNSGLSDDLVTRIVIDAENRKWIGVWGEGVDVWDDVAWTNFDPGNTEPSPPTCNETCSAILTCAPDTLGLISFFADPLGAGPGSDEVWIRNEDDGLCGLNGLSRHATGSWSTFTEQNSTLPSNFVDDAAAAADGSVWVASQNGAARWDGAGWTHFPDQRGKAVARLGSDMWLGTAEGVVRWDGRFQPGWIPDGLRGPRGYDLALEPSGLGAWIATNNGLHHHDGASFTEILDESNSDLPTGDVRSVLLASDGTLWAGMQIEGAARRVGATWEVFNPGNSGICCGNVTTLAEGLDGRIWAAYQFGGVSVWDGLSWQPGGAELPSTSVADIEAAPNGDLWFATPQGATRFDGAVWTTFTSADGLPADSVRTIHAHPDGSVWIGTSGGVSRFDGNAFESFDVGDNLVLAITHDADGNVWAAPRNGDIGIYDGAVWSTRGFDDGLVFPRVIALAGGVDDRTWIGTEMGLSIFTQPEPPQPGSVPGTSEGDPTVVPLRVVKPSGDPTRLLVTWGASCSPEVQDYALYAGDLARPFTGHLPATCSTASELSWEITTPAEGDRYYLVAAHAADREGSYGTDSSGAERAASSAACVSVQDRSPCP